MMFFFVYAVPMLMAFIFGSFVGSFANVCIYRMPMEMSLIYPPSHCPNCATPVGRDNIPILGYFLVKGRCRHCGAPIGFQYPLVEFVMAASFAALFYYFVFVLHRNAPCWESWSLWLIHAGLFAGLFIGSVIDIEHHIIPDEITLGGMALAPVISILVPWLHRPLVESGFLRAHERLSACLSSVVGIAVGMGFIALIGVLGTLAFRKEAMGLGDVKLMGLVGGLLGWKAALAVPILGAFLSLLFWAVALVRRRAGVIPFGPGLAAGAVTYVFLGHKYMDPILDLYGQLFKQLAKLIWH